MKLRSNLCSSLKFAFTISLALGAAAAAEVTPTGLWREVLSPPQGEVPQPPDGDVKWRSDFYAALKAL